jgi:hypothetical protein
MYGSGAIEAGLAMPYARPRSQAGLATPNTVDGLPFPAGAAFSLGDA